MTRLTREKVKNELSGEHASKYLLDFIDEIYDDFESRTCKNCSLWEGKVKNHPNDRECSFLYRVTRYDFGCNRWEPKQ